MKRNYIIVISALFILTATYLAYPKVSYYVRSRPVQNVDALRAEMIKSVQSPFLQADTLILDTRWMLCGSGGTEALPIVFDLKLEEDKYKSILKKKLKVPVVTVDEFHKVMDTVRKYRFHNEYPPSLWDSCRIGKVALDIKAEQLSSTKVRVYENYIYNESKKTINKEFKLKNDKWTFRIIDSSTVSL